MSRLVLLACSCLSAGLLRADLPSSDLYGADSDNIDAMIAAATESVA